MSKNRILHVEDSATDAAMVLRSLKKGGLDIESHRVWTEADFLAAVDGGRWDAVLSDCTLPGFGGKRALDLMRQRDQLTPFIVVSGTVGEEEAVSLIRSGANDFVAKTNLSRLPTTLIREIQESAVRAEHKKIRDQAELMAIAVAQSASMVLVTDVAGRIQYVNPKFSEVTGYDLSELTGCTPSILKSGRTEPAVYENLWRTIKSGGQWHGDLINRRKDGSQFYASGSIGAVKDNQRTISHFISIQEDLTARKNVENDKIRLSRALRLLSDCNLALVNAANEEELLANICKKATDVGGYLMAWVGYVDRNAEKTVRPVAHSGGETGYLEQVSISWDKTQAIGLGPVGKAIRTGSTQVIQDVITNASFSPWRESAKVSGYKSVISLPLMAHRDVFGALSIYAAQPNVFSADEVVLLEELARNLAFGIEVLRTRSENRRSQSELAVAAIAFNSQEGMIVTDADCLILRVNQSFIECTGYSESEAVGQTPRLLKSGRHDSDFYQAMWQSIKRSGAWQGEIWNRRKNGSEYPAWLTISSVKNKEGAITHYVGTQFDITERKLAEERINELAFFDQLTGLPNRRLLIDRLGHSVASCARDKRVGALLFIDLDHFKIVNDTYGHDQGDLLLQEVGARLRAIVRDADTVARIGGDEFVVVLSGLSQDSEDAAGQARTVGKKILDNLGEPYEIGGNEICCTPSIGITLFDLEHRAVEELMKQADIAMYQAKAVGRNNLRFFDPDLQAAIKKRAKLEKSLRKAIKKSEFFLHYQPQMNGKDLIGAEVLVRWKHPERGLVSPGEFIPLAEETGLILNLGHWVLEKACLQVAIWEARKKTKKLTLSVNVSARQFSQTDFVDQAIEVLKRTGANPNKIKLELTESMLAHNVGDVIDKMEKLKKYGLSFSLDDFGTGYSSLSYLKRLPLDQLKIDQSFVRDLLVDPNDGAIAQMIIALGQTMGLSVIAEGVETRKQHDFLAQMGCSMYQGYYFSRPLSLDDFEEFAGSSGNRGQAYVEVARLSPLDFPQ